MTNIASENAASSPSLMATAVKEGLIAGVVSFGMFILYIGIITSGGPCGDLREQRAL